MLIRGNKLNRNSERFIRDLQIDEEVRDGVVKGEEAVGFVGLFDDGVDVADMGDGFENLLMLVLVEVALFLCLLYHLVVLLHQGPSQPSLLVLPHTFLLAFSLSISKTLAIPKTICSLSEMAALMFLSLIMNDE